MTQNVKNLHGILVQSNSEKSSRVIQKISEVSSNGKFFSVQFLKKDGSVRDMNCRLGVEKHLKGGVKTLTDNYICVWDTQANGYRSINPETVQKVNGKDI